MVIFTTVVFGSTVGVLQKYLFSSAPAETAPEVTVSRAATGGKLADDEDFESVDLSESDSSYERVLHPNEERPAR